MFSQPQDIVEFVRKLPTEVRRVLQINPRTYLTDDYGSPISSVCLRLGLASAELEEDPNDGRGMAGRHLSRLLETLSKIPTYSEDVDSRILPESQTKPVIIEAGVVVERWHFVNPVNMARVQDIDGLSQSIRASVIGSGSGALVDPRVLVESLHSFYAVFFHGDEPRLEMVHSQFRQIRVEALEAFLLDVSPNKKAKEQTGEV